MDEIATAIIDGTRHLFEVSCNGRLFLRTNNGKEAKKAAYSLLSKEGGTAEIVTAFGNKTIITERRTHTVERRAA